MPEDELLNEPALPDATSTSELNKPAHAGLSDLGELLAERGEFSLAANEAGKNRLGMRHHSMWQNSICEEPVKRE